MVWPPGKENSAPSAGANGSENAGAAAASGRPSSCQSIPLPAQKRTISVNCTAPLPCSTSSASRRMYFSSASRTGATSCGARFQNERVRALQRLQPPHCLGFRGLVGSLGCIQTRDGKQLFCLPGKVGIRAGRLFTEAGQIFLCCGVDAAQGRNGPMAQAVAGVSIGLVRLVRHPALLKGAQSASVSARVRPNSGRQ